MKYLEQITLAVTLALFSYYLFSHNQPVAYQMPSTLQVEALAQSNQDVYHDNVRLRPSVVQSSGSKMARLNASQWDEEALLNSVHANNDLALANELRLSFRASPDQAEKVRELHCASQRCAIVAAGFTSLGQVEQYLTTVPAQIVAMQSERQPDVAHRVMQGANNQLEVRLTVTYGKTI